MNWDRKLLKSRGKESFRANYWPSVAVSVILMIATGAISVVINFAQIGVDPEALIDNLDYYMGFMYRLLSFEIIAVIISIVVLNPLLVGCYRFYLLNTELRGQISDMGYAFKNNFWNVIKGMFVKDLFVMLWTMLFFIPGIIKSYSYRMVPMILAENPNMGAREAITLSRKMMDGYKWKTFVLDLSFLGWNLLASLTAGILTIFYVAPYQYSTEAHLYRQLKTNYYGNTVNQNNGYSNPYDNNYNSYQ